MAVIIDMAMPKSCYECQFRNSCELAHANGWLCNHRDADCPLHEVKTGQWIEFDDYNTFRCSVCGILWTTIEGTPMDNDMNFCPNCGAKMEVNGNAEM